MPVTQWSEIAGEKCDECGKWATHWYGVSALCCECHGGNIVSPEDAAAAHKEQAFYWLKDEVIDALRAINLTWDEKLNMEQIEHASKQVLDALALVIDIEKVFELWRLEETDE